MSSSRWTVSPRGEIDDRLGVQLEAIFLERAPDLAEAGDLGELRVSDASRALRSVMSTICPNSTSTEPSSSRTGVTFTDAQTSRPSGRR